MSSDPASSTRTPSGSDDQVGVADPALERQGRRMLRPGLWLVLVAVVLLVPGVILILLGHGWSIGVGVAVVLIASVPGTLGVGLIGSSAVARWAARRKLFA